MTLSFDSHHIKHSHIFSQVNPEAEHKTQLAMIITIVVTLAEIAGGSLYNSMALLADGWHMSSHALALGLSLFAWRLARRYADDQRFSFGSWKIEVLGGYTSAVLLAGIALLMAFESISRLLHPQPIAYNQAIAIASSGLLVNVICAWLLKDDHTHQHSHADHQHHDLNLQAAYIHVLADAATSILAISALIAGKFWQAVWLDPVMGIAGALVIVSWAYRLLHDAGKVLLDAEMDSPLVRQIRDLIENASNPATITDLHLWRVGKDHYACILVLLPKQKTEPEYYRKQLQSLQELAHITIEINHLHNNKAYPVTG